MGDHMSHNCNDFRRGLRKDLLHCVANSANDPASFAFISEQVEQDLLELERHAVSTEVIVVSSQGPG